MSARLGVLGQTLAATALATMLAVVTAAPAPAATGSLLRNDTGLYPRAIRLEHNGAANGRVLASVVTFGGNPVDGLGAIYESTDAGATFAQVGTVADPEAGDGRGLCCSTLYELPQQIGAMPAGTLLWAASVRADARPMAIRIWKSNDIGRSWSYLSNCVTAPNTRGTWEPEFSVASDGRLVCHYADETDAAHSQKLMKVRSTDGITWTDRSASVASTASGHRPGMPVVRKLPDGRYVMVYEICGLGGQYDCVVHWRDSADGWSWGTPSALGIRPQTVDGKYFTHTPTLAWAPSVGNSSGKLLLVGQILQNANGSVAADNGRTVLVNTEGAHGNWYEIPAPVAVTNPYNNFCPNYSSPLLPSADGARVLEIATDYDGPVCKPYYATASAIGSQDAAGIVSGATYRAVAVISGHCLDVAADSRVPGGNIQQWTCNGLGPQNFVVTHRAEGWYTFVGQNSQLCMDVENGSPDAGADVRQWTCNAAPAQDWRIVNVGRGYYKVVSRASGHCLDVAGGSGAPGANVAQWFCNNLAPQTWRFERR
ncbi:RICIN domain-containing protein [Tenggerimyces flavus]|uniref:RICIN domain-containing protein n=1 Tax=Tenggerimyces flavus TaxID=1708749 RepID=A0ABV7YC50_9ACTN|nr:RICIN domain-containing protein [Tenggerimyces flavus]MBM7786876.1 hypothetical protein [Tenggerimyces flavus]